MQPAQYLGRVGVWTMALEPQPAAAVRDVAAELEDLGYGTIWFGEAFGRDAYAQASLLLSATSRAVIATGVANIFLRDPHATAATQRTLAEAYDGRFLLGLGGHRTTTQPEMTLPFHGNALDVMRDYLTAMDNVTYQAAEPAGPPRRVLGALGPKMLALSGEMAWGAHTYLVPPEHTARARDILGPDAVLAVEQKVVLDTDRARAHALVRDSIGIYLNVAHHQVNNLRRLGFTAGDLADGGSDRLVDALVVTGDVDTIAKRVQEHLDAGADHVCLQPLTATPDVLPTNEWRELAVLTAQ
ncbi:TIGR03620 family F420-dependent LLM class oxidoreductase [Kibdelosporangium lantanae]